MKINSFSYEGKIYGIKKKQIGDKTLSEFSMSKSKKNKEGGWDTVYLNMKCWQDFPYEDKSELTVHGYIDGSTWEKDGKRQQKIEFVVNKIDGVSLPEEVYTVNATTGKPAEEDLPF